MCGGPEWGKQVKRMQFGLKNVLAASVAIIIPALALAQDAQFDPENLISACRLDTCQTEVNRVLQNLESRQLDDEQFNSQLGLIAAVLLEVGLDGDPENVEHVANALAGLATYSTDSLQRDALRGVALGLSRGDPDLLKTSEAVAASPARPGRGRIGRGRPRFTGIF